jgi:transcriptional regulator of heat shock response
MKEVIINETNKVFIKALERFAKQNDQDVKDIQLIIALDESQELIYKYCIKGVAKENVTLKQVLGIKNIDFKGFTMIIPPYLMQIFSKLIQEQNSANVEVVICFNTVKEYCRYFLFDKGQKVKEIYLENYIE